MCVGFVGVGMRGVSSAAGDNKLCEEGEGEGEEMKGVLDMLSVDSAGIG